MVLKNAAPLRGAEIAEGMRFLNLGGCVWMFKLA